MIWKVMIGALMLTVGVRGVSLPELEFLVAEMSSIECQQLADALRADFTEKNSEQGVTCLDELIRQESELESEGSNIARGVLRHKLNQVGRRDLAEWLSLVKDSVGRSRPRSAAMSEAPTPNGGLVSFFKKEGPRSWCDVAVTACLLYTAALLVWLTVRVLLCKMKRELRARGLAGRGHGYEYFPANFPQDGEGVPCTPVTLQPMPNPPQYRYPYEPMQQQCTHPQTLQLTCDRSY